MGLHVGKYTVRPMDSKLGKVFDGFLPKDMFLPQMNEG